MVEQPAAAAAVTGAQDALPPSKAKPSPKAPPNPALRMMGASPIFQDTARSALIVSQEFQTSDFDSLHETGSSSSLSPAPSPQHFCMIVTTRGKLSGDGVRLSLI